MMHERGKSDSAVRAVIMKPANKTERSAAELVERRAGTKGECRSAKHAPGLRNGKVYHRSGTFRRGRGRFVCTRDTLQCWHRGGAGPRGDINLLIGIAISVTTLKSAKAHGTCCFAGYAPPES
jgi:hypothetical protein